MLLILLQGVYGGLQLHQGNVGSIEMLLQQLLLLGACFVALLQLQQQLLQQPFRVSFGYAEQLL